jgi:sugar/nucleoside kinase (ribokinase family)
MHHNKIIISGTGCALVDLLYTNIRFNSHSFSNYTSRQTGDGGLSPGKLVFTEELEKFSGKPYPSILKDITAGVSPNTFNIGGPGLVSLIHAAQILSADEFEVRFFGLTGNDPNADRIHELLQKTPLDVSNYQIGSDMATPFTDVFSDPTFNNGQGERTFVNNIGAAWDYSPDNLPDDFFNSLLVCFGGTALVPQIHDGLTQLLKKAKNNACITVVNTVYDFRNEKANPTKKWPLVTDDKDYCLIDVLIMDREEALKISGQPTICQAVEYFKSKNTSTVIITNGSENITAWSNGKLFQESPIFELPVSAKVAEYKGQKGDTTGCGDNFAGGIIASVAQQLKSCSVGNLDLTEALSWAVASGGFACFYVGGTWFESRSGEKMEKVIEFQQAYMRQLKKDSI